MSNGVGNTIAIIVLCLYGKNVLGADVQSNNTQFLNKYALSLFLVTNVYNLSHILIIIHIKLYHILIYCNILIAKNRTCGLFICIIVLRLRHKYIILT